jgi:hypothetical protein
LKHFFYLNWFKYVLSITKDLFDSYQNKRRLRVDAKCLFWTPKIPTKPTNQFQTK